MLASDLAQHLHAVHARHFQIESDNVRTKLLNLAQSDQAVHSCAHDLDGGIAEQCLGDQLAHQRRIIDHEHADLFIYARVIPAGAAHAVAPSGNVRERCEIKAGTFRINTTVPSPRMEAPLTSGDATRRSSSALMTSSSSPTRLSTANPNRRPPR